MSPRTGREGRRCLPRLFLIVFEATNDELRAFIRTNVRPFFSFVEWLLILAAVNAAAVKTGSQTLYALYVVGFTVLLVYTASVTFIVVNHILAAPALDGFVRWGRRLPRPLRYLVAVPTVILVSGLTGLLSHRINRAIELLIEQLASAS